MRLAKTLAYSRPVRMPVLRFDVRTRRQGRGERKWERSGDPPYPVPLCVLRGAEMTLEEIGLAMGLTREACRLILLRAVKRFEWHWFLMYEFEGGQGWRDVFRKE